MLFFNAYFLVATSFLCRILLHIFIRTAPENYFQFLFNKYFLLFIISVVPYLAVTLSGRLITAVVKAAASWTVTRAADWMSPPGGRADLVETLFTVLTRPVPRTHARVAVDRRRPLPTGGASITWVEVGADAQALRPHSTWIPERHDPCQRLRCTHLTPDDRDSNNYPCLIP